MPTKRKITALVILAAIYFVTGKLGLTLAYLHPSATAVWPPAGIALAALLIFGYELWPAILLGAFLVNISTAGSALVCIGIAIGNTLESVAGAWLVNRYARGRNAIYSTPDIFKFALLAGLVSTALSATIGVTSLTLGGAAPWSNYRAIWTTWWLGDAAGVMLIGSLLLAWIGRPRLRWRKNQYFEAAALLAALVLTSLVVFDGLFSIVARNYPLEYICMPLLLWVGYRFGTREAAAATLVLAGSAIWGTLHGYGPFGNASHNESLLLLQAFVSVVGVTTMGLATAFAERRIAEEQSHFLAVSDPLTGLGNYRKLIDTLEMEIHRSSRTGRPFALLLLDMDDLKRVNDNFGHVVGSRALCRLGAALRLYSRNIDTPARYGGDEFALIIPELGPDLGREIWQDEESAGQKLRVRVKPGTEPEIGTEPPRRRASDRARDSVSAQNPERAAALASDRAEASGAGDANREIGGPESKHTHEIVADFKTEAGTRAVQHVAQRIASSLANDGEFPRLTVSIGAAQFPADGENIEQLLNAADQALYRNKREKKHGAGAPSATAARPSTPQSAVPPSAAPHNAAPSRSSSPAGKVLPGAIAAAIHSATAAAAASRTATSAPLESANDTAPISESHDTEPEPAPAAKHATSK